MHNKGFTVVEILVVIMIMALLSVIVLSGFAGYRNAQSLKNDTDLVLAVLRQARTQTLASQGGTTYGVHFASSTITLFSGSSYVDGVASNDAYTLDTHTQLNLALNGGSSDVIFKRLSGETDHYGTITVATTVSTSTRTITIFKTGLVQ
jgi:prepilin-type N-terminal cleavage/methylation domain-containing protein